MSKTLTEVLEAKKMDFQSLLPAEISVDRFLQISNNAILYTDGVKECTPQSIIKALVKCATDNLLPDGREATITVRNCKQKDGTYKKEAVYTPMYRGLLKQIYATGEVVKISCNCVFENDFFEIELGDEERIVHKPTLGDRGNFKCVYSIIKMKNGEINHCWMTPQEIDKVKDIATTQTIWTSWYNEMAQKTVLRRAVKIIPTIERKIEAFLERDNENFEFSKHDKLDFSKFNLPRLEELPKEEIIEEENAEIKDLQDKGLLKKGSEL